MGSYGVYHGKVIEGISGIALGLTILSSGRQLQGIAFNIWVECFLCWLTGLLERLPASQFSTLTLHPNFQQIREVHFRPSTRIVRTSHSSFKVWGLGFGPQLHAAALKVRYVSVKSLCRVHVLPVDNQMVDRAGLGLMEHLLGCMRESWIGPNPEP